MTVKQNKIIAFILIIVMMSIALYFSDIDDKKNQKEIKDNIELVEGVVSGIENAGTWRVHVWTVEYSYYVNGNVLHGSRRHDVSGVNRNYYIGKQYMVAFSSKHNEVSYMLMNKYDSVQYGIISKY